MHPVPRRDIGWLKTKSFHHQDTGRYRRLEKDAEVPLMSNVKALSPEALYQRCDPEQFTFKTTANKPRALRLPPGQGGMLRLDMDRLVGELHSALRTVFESESVEPNFCGTLYGILPGRYQQCLSLQVGRKDG